MYRILDIAVKGDFPIVIIADGIEKEALAPIIQNNLKGILKAAAVKSPTFGERKSHYLDDIAILTGGTVIRDNAGLTLERVQKDMFGTASKLAISHYGSTQATVKKRLLKFEGWLRTQKKVSRRKF